MMKKCNHCGTTENLFTRTVKGKFQILSICYDCKSKQMKEMWKENKDEISEKISNKTKETIENDQKQNKTIPNLIRVWESEFKKNPDIIFEKIQNKKNENLMIIGV